MNKEDIDSLARLGAQALGTCVGEGKKQSLQASYDPYAITSGQIGAATGGLSGTLLGQELGSALAAPLISKIANPAAKAGLDLLARGISGGVGTVLGGKVGGDIGRFFDKRARDKDRIYQQYVRNKEYMTGGRRPA